MTYVKMIVHEFQQTYHDIIEQEIRHYSENVV